MHTSKAYTCTTLLDHLYIFSKVSLPRSPILPRRGALVLRLRDVAGGSALGAHKAIVVTIKDDDVPTEDPELTAES